MPKNICPRGWYIPLSFVAVPQGSGILSNSDNRVRENQRLRFFVKENELFEVPTGK
jgi:hypothetical protein